MKNLRRKERDAGATIAEADGSPVLTRLSYPLLLEKVVGHGRMFHWVSTAFLARLLVLIPAPAGRLE
jgi:hypothetical protein